MTTYAPESLAVSAQCNQVWWMDFMALKFVISNLEIHSKMHILSALTGQLRASNKMATKWLWRYNTERPNMTLGEITPK